MSYRVEWRIEALDLVQREWRMLPASGKKAVMDAFDEVERLLASDPLELGESRADEFVRVLAQAPLIVAYRVDPRLGSVSIFGARLILLP